MRARTQRTSFDEPSLVPLADMLTNTVGIMVFILIFTVLTAGGAVLVKRLPMEHATEQRSLTFICWDNRVYPFSEKLFRQFLEPLGKPEPTASGRQEFTDKFAAQRVEDAYVTLTGEVDRSGARTDLVIVCVPKAGAGETADELRRPGSAFQRALAAADRQKQFFMFNVRPDSIDAFGAARDAAAAAQVSTGWSPQLADQPIRFSLTGQGRMAKPQQ